MALSKEPVIVWPSHSTTTDVALWEGVLRFIRDFKPDRIVLHDGIDNYTLSRFSRDPEGNRGVE